MGKILSIGLGARVGGKNPVSSPIEAGFLPALDKNQANMFTTLELLPYRHAQDHRLLTLDILGYPSLFGDILGLST